MKRRILIVAVVLLGFTLPAFAGDSLLEKTVGTLADRLVEKCTPAQLIDLDSATVMAFLTPEERHILANEYWSFDTNVPVVVSVMLEKGQKITPFWLAEYGFNKTDLRVRNEEYVYEVWQKEFPVGRVNLGIPGLERYRPIYFASIGPKKVDDKVELTGFHPSDQRVLEMKVGAHIYHDWPDLVLSEVPDSLKGQILLPTYRGRARESHLVGAFRNTLFPSSAEADQFVLTWSKDPQHTQTVHWRTDSKTLLPELEYRAADAPGDAPWLKVLGKMVEMKEYFIINDRQTRHYEATIEGLDPNTAYSYRVGSSPVMEFRTAPDTDKPMEFVTLADTHCNPEVSVLLNEAMTKYPDTAFCSIAGDLVGMGQNLDDWDKLFGYGKKFFAARPLMPSIGNHDAIDGLGAGLYLGLLGLPENGPKGVPVESSYSFEYANAFFVMLDVTTPVEEHTAWLDAELAKANGKWTFVVFHFPPYSPDDSNPEIMEKWVPVMEKHKVDFVVSGHVHNYLRTKPIRNGNPVAKREHGIVYVITVAVKGRDARIPKPDYAEAWDASGANFFTHFRVEKNRVVIHTEDGKGKCYDEAVYNR